MFRTIVCATVVCAAAVLPLPADQWSKSFSVGAAPELRVETSDANITVKAGTAKTIEARVTTSGWKIGPGEIHVFDHQSGDRVEIEVKYPTMHFGWGDRWVKIEVQVPAATKADLRTGDGNIHAAGLRGARLSSHDGNIDGESLDGMLEASSGDGNIRVQGKFSGLNLHSGDGNIDAKVEAGSRMAANWNIQAGDGGVTLRLPDGFAANLDAHTGDGSLTVDLPVAGDGKHENSVSGKLNGGGPTLMVRTGDGSVHLTRM